MLQQKKGAASSSKHIPAGVCYQINRARETILFGCFPFLQVVLTKGQINFAKTVHIHNGDQENRLLSATKTTHTTWEEWDDQP